jgi:hypothetical protein
VAGRARLCHREEPLVHLNLAGAAALGARDRRRARFGAAAAASRTGSGSVELDGDGRAAHRVVEADAHARLEIRTAGRATCAAAAGAAGERTEQVAEVADVEVLEPDAATAGEPPAGEAAPLEAPSGAARTEPGRGHVADLVVLLALVLVANDVVCRRDLLEALLGCSVTRVGVGVVALRELAVRLLDLGLRGVLRHAEDLVVVLLEPLAPDVAVHGRPS